eukprot:NODE_15_length_42055_cov_0.634117.p3 type:complete len:864 gc:universal NODE_15_length_42055_cov_0.634117:20498-23089(+)
MYSVFVVLHKVKNIIPSKVPVYFECTLNNEKLTSEPMVATSEMTVDTELVFYLNEQQYTFLKQNRLNCKLSCYQKPKKLIGFVLLDVRKSESQLPPVHKKWHTLLNTSYTPRPQLLIGFGVGLVPEKPNEFENDDVLSPARLISQALQSWSPNIYLNVHQGIVCIGNGKSVFRMTCTISAHSVTQNESIAMKLLNKTIILDNSKSTSIHQMVFEGDINDLLLFWKSTVITIFHVQHHSIKPVKLHSHDFILYDYLSGLFSSVELGPFAIKLECIGFPKTEIEQLNRKNIQAKAIEKPDKMEPKSVKILSNKVSQDDSNASILESNLKSNITSNAPHATHSPAHQFRLSIDLVSITPHVMIKSPISIEYHYQLINQQCQFTTNPFSTIHKIESYISNGFCAYEFIVDPCDLLNVLIPVTINLYLVNEYKNRELLATASIPISNVLNVVKTPELQGMGDLQLVDHLVQIRNVGDLKCTVALEDFGIMQDEEKYEQETHLQLSQHENEQSAKLLSKEKETENIAINEGSSPIPQHGKSTSTPKSFDNDLYKQLHLKYKPQTTSTCTQTTAPASSTALGTPTDGTIIAANKKQLDHLFTGYKQVEQLIQEVEQLENTLTDKLSELASNNLDLIKSKQLMNQTKESLLSQHESVVSELKVQHQNELKKQLLEIEHYKELSNKLTNKSVILQQQNKELARQVDDGKQQLMTVKQTFNNTNISQLQQDNYTLKEGQIQLSNKLQKSEQVKQFYKDKCKEIQSVFDVYKQQHANEKSSKMDKDAKMVENMKWRYMLQEEEKKNQRDIGVLEQLQMELMGIKSNKKSNNIISTGDAELDRLVHEKRDLLKTGLYYNTDPVILQINEKIKSMA